MPVLVDPSPNSTWSSWGAGQRDLFFLDVDGNYYTHFNIGGSGWNYDNVYNTIMSILPEDETCDEIQDLYESIHINSEYKTCNYDNDCTAVWGHCDVGLGGCHYAINNFYPDTQVNDLATQWIENNCTEFVCDCLELPYAQCLDGICSAAYCIDANPAGCFQTGCDEGYECIASNGENDCTPSSCFCDETELGGNWYCTEDCNGGTCEPINLLGDLNYDGELNVIDVVSLVNITLNDEWNELGDVNNDGELNVIDIVMLVNIILE